MATPQGLIGETVGAYAPDPSGTYPDYSTPGEKQIGTVDPLGHVMGRDQVLTDEGGFRDPFAGAALSAAYTTGTAGGSDGTIVVTNSELRINAGTVVGSRIWVSRTADFLPVIANFFARLTARQVNVNAYMGLYQVDAAANPSMDPRDASVLEFVEWAWLGSQPAAGAGSFSARAATNGNAAPGLDDVGSSAGTASSVIAFSASSNNWRQIALDGEGAFFRDNSTVQVPATLPIVIGSTRANIARNSPSLYTTLFVSMWMEIVGAPGGASELQIDTLFLKNINRLNSTGSF
jgi:hypothetical protein